MRRVPPRQPTLEQPGDKRAESRRASSGRILFGTAIVVAVLHLAKPVVVPIALAILFAFMLTPIVVRLERTFIRRTGAIVLALGLTSTALAFGGWWLYQQFSAVAKTVSTAATNENVDRKLQFLRRTGGSTLEVVERTLQRVAEARDRPEREDLKVRVIPERKTLGDRYEEVAPTVEGVAAGFLVVVVVFFLLRDREQLRDKLLRLAGRAHLTVTTQAIGETRSEERRVGKECRSRWSP